MLIAGVATRGFAESAARAGYEVIALDGFGDLDLRGCACGVVVARAGERFSARAAVRAARTIARDAVCYVASFENHPRAVGALARRGTLWGNAPAVLGRVRDPAGLARAFAARGFATPAVRLTPPAARPDQAWLVKPRASGGGGGIAPLGRRRRPVPAGHYLQQRITGVAGSIVFAADGGRAVPLGVSLQLTGERAFGANGFRYCGSILARVEPGLRAIAGRLAAAVTEDFGLVGVNGLDFVAAGGVPYPLEVNPRYSASMELVERATGVSIFEIHARACAGALPAADLAATLAPGAIGKAIVYARRAVTVPDTRAWLEDDTVRDVPTPGARIARGQPICTVFARGTDAARCRAALALRARALYRAVEVRRRSVA
ncbi:MAG TPA: ATP-grasp domain-containing protein [Gemmatimonadales bacterium]|nr:ATP-grasp domain-containing protein [Gemmatimonadales bacterium]